MKISPDRPFEPSDGSEKVALGGALSLSSFASFVGLCCIGPWSVALLGVNGAVAFARWQPYRPLILGLAAILLLWAGWQVYRGPKNCDTACSRKRSLWFKGALVFSIAFLLLAVFAEQLQWIVFDPTPEWLRE